MRARQLLQYIIIATAFAGITDVSCAASNDSVRALYETDQSERKAQQPDFARMNKNDQDRRARVLKLLQASQLKTAEDYYHAAMIYQHGASLADIRLAYSLINIAVTLQADQLRYQRMRALAWDRMMLQLNRPQWYGSQSINKPGSQLLQLYEVDETAVSDEERKALGLPALAEAKAEIENINAQILKQQAAMPANAVAASQAAAKPVSVSFHRAAGSGHELLAVDHCLAMFWIKLSDMGLPQPLLANLRVAQPRMMVVRRDEKEILSLLDDKTKIANPSTGNEACFFDYIAYTDADRHLVLDLMLDDKVVPGPTFEVKPYKYFRVRLGQLDADLKGKQVELLQAEKIPADAIQR